jgi:hypothetical protein
VTTLLNVQQLVDRFREKSEATSTERVQKTKELFESIIGPVSLLDDKFTPVAAIELAKTLRENKDKILGYHHVVRKTDPEAARQLERLLAIVRKTRGLFRTMNLNEAGEFMHDKRTKPLVSALRENIDMWLSDNG